MFVLKLIAFLCVIVQAENEFSWMDKYKAPLSPKENDLLDLISWAVFGYTVEQLRTMYSQNNFEKVFNKNNAVWSEFKKKVIDSADKSSWDPLFAYSIFYILSELGSGATTREEALAKLTDTWEKMSKDSQDQFKKYFDDFLQYRISEIKTQ